MIIPVIISTFYAVFDGIYVANFLKLSRAVEMGGVDKREKILVMYYSNMVATKVVLECCFAALFIFYEWKLFMIMLGCYVFIFDILVNIYGRNKEWYYVVENSINKRLKFLKYPVVDLLLKISFLAFSIYNYGQ